MLDVTHELFYGHGIHATELMAASAADVAPTMQARPGSKDGLVAAYVEQAGALYRTWFDQSLASADRPARERLLGLFEALDEQVAGELPGCPFLMALAEIPMRAIPRIGTRSP